MIDFIETKRLILRPVQMKDAPSFFEMDSNPDVLKYIGVPTTRTISETEKMIAFLLEQYQNHSIGRYAVIDKETNEFLGWSGLKHHSELINGCIDFFDLGYRFLPQHWGKGYATESSKAWIKYAFEELKLEKVYAMTDIRHTVSKKVLLKVGFKYVNRFEYPHEPWIGDPTDWFIAQRKHS